MPPRSERSSVAAFYLIAQMVGAGALIDALVGIDFNVAVIATGVFMLVYVVFGGMLATTWVQIVKAVLLMIGATVLSVFVLAEIGWNPIDIFERAENQSDDPGRATSRRAFASPSRSTPCRLDSGWCWAPPACRTS